ncbi:type II secretion system F family protein [Thiospirochaeta perfilievii]|uniref:Type II secretion system F family protein n=1 Tax=Thiospirochaeta perfilievii TaxID=252967 RepID=A0A5C1QDC8_9SPIO|nr:type II secretion system F family protein [Thiospirochaeta perfilievii]QEN04212.1 type II secretion system F family protein [Thiospirochaeta perfilievii]
MLKYRCKAVNSSGTVVEVTLDARDKDELYTLLRDRDLSLLSAIKVNSSRLKLNKNQIITFTQTISLLLNSNLSIQDAIKIGQTSFTDKKVVTLSNLITENLDRGESLSGTLKTLNPGFSDLYIGLIEVGETTGNLKKVINQLHFFLDREKKFNDKLIGAIIYPIIVLSMTLIFSVVFVIFILPGFNEMFQSLGGGLADTLVNRGRTLTTIVTITTLLLAIVVLIHLKRDQKIEEIYLKIPFIGKIVLENETFNLIFALSVLTESSLTIENSLDYGKNVLKNSYLKSQIDSIKNSIICGSSLSLAFRETLFPSKVSSFIQVGEKTGNITSIFNELSSYYLKESEKRIERFMTVIDPIFTLLLGSGLLLLISTFILPVLTKMGDLL